MMDKTRKVIIAREWLYFLGSICFSLIILPLLGSVIRYFLKGEVSFRAHFELYKIFMPALLGTEGTQDFLSAWLIFLTPYFIFQLIRSINWARKQIKQK